MLDLADTLYVKIKELTYHINICGFVDKNGFVLPVDSDTKVLSTIFEKLCHSIILDTAYLLKYDVFVPEKQNYYPDFTLHEQDSMSPKGKIAFDVKSTYRDKTTDSFAYTLGSYTSFIRDNKKNIEFPFNEYSEHWIIGFVYDRVEQDIADFNKEYTIENLAEIPLPYKNIDVFVQEKWRIAGDRAGSGNTANIGSIHGTIEDFRAGNGPFRSEKEFLKYWQNYGRTKKERENSFSNIHEFRELYK